MKKIVSLLLILIFCLSLFGASASAEGGGRTADVVILFTSDVHCGIDQGFGYAGLQAVRDYLIGAGNEVILVDDGDNVQGEPVGTLTKGEALTVLMNQMGYSVAIPGNHEFDYGMEQFLALAEMADFDYISCNFNCKGELVFPPYVIRELGGLRLAFVGVTTPLTMTTTSPRSFQDENGEFVYGFFQDESGEGVYSAVQSAVDAARAEGADYVIAMAHLGNEEECRPWTYDDVISHTNGIDAFLDGHSHDSDQVVMKNKDGKAVLRSACGTKLSSIGWCRIDTAGKISTGLYTWDNDVPAPELLGLHNEMSGAVGAAMEKLNEKLQEVVAFSAVDLRANDPVLVDGNGRAIRIVRLIETNLGDLCADAYRVQSGADIAFVNAGGIGSNLPAGSITFNDILKVHPHGNEICVIEVTGQQILDALEWGARSIPVENGSFLQVSGLSFEIHSYIDSPCLSTDNSMFAGIEGERRVKNVLVGGVPIDPAATYTLAGHNFMLYEFGGGFTMFEGSPIVRDRFKLDNQVLIDYITDSLGGVIGQEYEELTGQDRIVIIEQAP